MKKRSAKALYFALFLMAIMSVANVNTYAQEDFSSDDIVEEESEQVTETIDEEESTEGESENESFDESD